MKYDKICEGVFIDRPNRFIAHVEINGKIETVHVKNTGRCKELLIPKCKVILYDSANPARKTRYDLIAVWKNNLGWVNIDSMAPNQVVKEWLSESNDIFSNITYMKPEHKYGDSRIDFYLEQGEEKIFVEVKGCTLEIDGEGYFPDAPTERGVKHLEELTKAQKKGYSCYIAFVIAMEGIKVVHPHKEMHPEFAAAMKKAKRSGVKVLFLPCKVKADELIIIEALFDD